MPELGPKNLSFAKKVKQEPNPGYLTFNKMFDLATDYDEEYLGHGGEVVVVRHKSRPERVVAFNYKDVRPEQAKEIFYLHRFFSILFPHNFPQFYFSAGKDPKKMDESISGTVRQEIKRTKNISLPAYYPFAEIEKSMHELGISVKFDYESRGNFILGEDGGEYYVDTIRRPNVSEWDWDKISQYMQKNKYTQGEMQMVETCVNRLKELNLFERGEKRK